MCKSEVALLRQQIAFEVDSMQRGFDGIASGVTRHDFIHARMQQIGTYQESLAHHIGVDAATLDVCQLYMQKMEGDAHSTAS
jgi:hypothetical protein